MSSFLDPAKLRLARTVADDARGFLCAAADIGGQRLYLGGTDFSIHVFNLRDLVPSIFAPLRGHRSYVTAIRYLPGPRLLISGGFDRQLLWWEPARSTDPVRRLMIPGRVQQLAASADGNYIATATDDTVGRVWEVATGRLLVELQGGHPPTTRLGRANTLYTVAFSPDGKRVATGDRAGSIGIWETATGKLVRPLTAATFYSQATPVPATAMASEYEWGGVRALAFSADGGLLIAGGMGPADPNSAGTDGKMRIEAFDTATGKSLAAHHPADSKGMLMSMFLHDGGPWVIAAGGGGQNGVGFGGICLWDPKLVDKDKKPVAPIHYKSPLVIREIVPNSDGQSLLTVGTLKEIHAGRIEVWDGTAPALPSKK